jgi:hypothetical protein
VSNGTLLVSGALGSSAVTVRNGATLGGSGVIGGAATVANGGTLSPGASLGTLTISNNLVLAGHLFIEVNKSATPNSDRVVVGGTLTNAGTGTLTVANLGATGFVAGDRFVVFNKALLNGEALTLTPLPGSGLAWTNKLALDGSIEVVSNAAPPIPTTTTLNSSANPAHADSNVTFTATVRTNGFTATSAPGVVTFKHGAATLGSQAVSGGVALWTTSTLPPGTNLITAEYSGGGLYLASTSAPLAQVITNLAVFVSTNFLVPAGALWRYLDDGSDQGTAWRAPTFNDAAWKLGPAQLGYGDGDETTVVSYGPTSTNKYITTYFRRSFLVFDTNAVTGLRARLLRDDGAVVYLNGVEVWRSNMPTNAINYLTLAVTNVGGVDETNHSYTNDVSPSLLLAGTNVVAVEIHQSTNTSSDISFDFAFDATVRALAQPILTTICSGGIVTLSAGPEASFFQLYSTRNLTAPVWTRATNEPVLSNGLWLVPIPVATNESRFYRLQTQ